MINTRARSRCSQPSKNGSRSGGGSGGPPLNLEYTRGTEKKKLDADRDWLTYVRSYLVNCIKLCRFNPAGEAEGFGPSVQHTQLPVWSHVAALFHLYFCVKLFAMIIVQHQYNMLASEAGNNHRHLNHTNIVKAYNLTTSNHAIEWQQQLEDVIARNKLMGNAFIELGFGAELLFACIWYTVNIGTAQPHLYLALRGQMTFNFLQMLLDDERERKHVTNCKINRQISKFIVSSLSYVLVRRDAIRAAASGPERLLEFQRAARRVELAHNHAVQLVRNMARKGYLVPLNRRPEWLPEIARVFGQIIAMYEIGSLILIFATVVLLPYTGLLRFKLLTGPLDIIFQLELLTFCVLGIRWLGFPLITVIVTAFDQLKFVNELRRTISHLIRDIRLERDFSSCSTTTTTTTTVTSKGTSGQNLATQETTGGQCVEEFTHYATATTLNARLIRALILYRLLEGQMRETREAVGNMGAHLIVVMLLLPIGGRLFSGYVVLEVRLLILAGAIAFIIAIDLFALPNCLLHARCLHLFKSMSCLLAHIEASRSGRFDQDCGLTAQRTIAPPLSAYDEHAVRLLRRTQNMPELARRRFAIDALFVQLTFSSFIGIHFWCGLLLVPLFLRDTASFGITGNPFSETLTIF